MGIRLLVCGGRDYNDVNRVHDTLNGIRAERPIDLLIHGDAKGADWWANQWAIANGVDVCKFPANWHKWGKGAGPRRNAVMLTINPDLVVAFPGGRGTADMMSRAKAFGIEVMQIGREHVRGE